MPGGDGLLYRQKASGKDDRRRAVFRFPAYIFSAGMLRNFKFMI